MPDNDEVKQESALDGFFVGPTETFMDKVTDEKNLIKSGESLKKIDPEDAPDYAGQFEAIKGIRDLHDSLSTYTSWGRVHAGGEHYKRVASIPAPLLEAALQLEPDLLINKKKFYKWLDKHPGYSTVHRKKSWRSNGKT